MNPIWVTFVYGNHILITLTDYFINCGFYTSTGSSSQSLCAATRLQQAMPSLWRTFCPTASTKRKGHHGHRVGVHSGIFAVYAGSCFVTCGKLFSKLFGQNYQLMMVVGALFVLLYTFLGGFLAESASDFMQAVVMIIALVLVLTLGVSAAGGFLAVLENARQIPGFFDFFFTATPQVDANGVQQLTAAGQPFFGDAQPYPLLTILSELAWGLGYFGMVIALDENSIIFTLVSFAWAGFGATFGPLVLFSLFWKRTTRAGAIAGMIGGGMVFFWKLVLKPLGGLWGIYELLPAFPVLLPAHRRGVAPDPRPQSGNSG